MAYISAMPFEVEYRMDVESKAQCIADDIIDTAEWRHYETDIFCADVVKMIRKRLREDGYIRG